MQYIYVLIIVRKYNYKTNLWWQVPIIGKGGVYKYHYAKGIQV
jgi:hypothetical protein